MYDKEIAADILTQIYEATQKVLKRFQPIINSDDFLNTAEGMVILDAICMQIIAIGESLKKIDTITNGELLSHYTEIDWKGAKGMRDIISHHYFDIDAEEIYWVCKFQVKPLSETIKKMLKDIA